MNIWTRVFLVLLRLAIGWHFLFEGIAKLESWNDGPREGRPEWSASGYLSESQGPLRQQFRQYAGEPNKDAIAKLTLPREVDKLPQALEADWINRFDRFVKHYELGKHAAVQPEDVGVFGLSPIAPFPATIPWGMVYRSASSSKGEQPQITHAKQDIELARQAMMRWFTQGSREVSSKIPGVVEKVKETTSQRIAVYKLKLQQISDIEEQGMPAFDRDVWKEKYRTLKLEVAQMRSELLHDLDKPFQDALSAAKFRLSQSQRDKGPVPPVTVGTSNLDRVNFVTAWGLTIVGGCLLLGLFTRSACIAGALFLLLISLAMPALPWVPANPRSEGHYLFVDKNIIEMLALLALATTSSGKWLGVDAMLHLINPFRRRKQKTNHRGTETQRKQIG